MPKYILAQAAFTWAVDLITRAAKKAGLDGEELERVFAAVLAKHFPQRKLPLK